jgi:hypothetical protein
LEILRDYGLPGEQILRASAEEQLLEKMQKSFTWANERIESSRQ